jgi:hypothetical protein
MQRRALAVLAAFSLLGCAGSLGVAAGPAAAAPLANVVAAIKNQTHLIETSPGESTLRHLTLAAPAAARASLPGLMRLRATMAYAAADVSHATTQSPVQRSAKRAWVRGVRDEAAAVGQLEAAAREVGAGHREQIRPHLSRALRLLLGGARNIERGDALLDLAHNSRTPTLHLSGS